MSSGALKIPNEMFRMPITNTHQLQHSSSRRITAPMESAAVTHRSMTRLAAQPLITDYSDASYEMQRRWKKLIEKQLPTIDLIDLAQE